MTMATNRKVAQESSYGFPVQIIDIRDGKLELKKKALQDILMQRELKSMPVMVLSIAGVFRSGKSFLLNLLVQHLSENVNKLDGFRWNSGTDRVTTGIWMWSKIFSITLPDGRKIGVVLMDTQGTQDPKTSQKENAALFALSTLLSSVQIYNVKDYINEGDLHFLELFVRYGIAIKGGDKKPFQTLLFLIRDWRNVKEFSFGEEQGTKYLNKCMATSPGQGKENMEVRDNISGVFNNLKCYLMPSPGDEVLEGNARCVLKETSRRFQVQLMDLIQVLFASEISKAQRPDGTDMTCERLVTEFKIYTYSINSGKGFNITTMAEANAIAHENKIFRMVLSDYEGKMKKICETYQENLKEIMEEKKKIALENFKKDCGSFPSKEYEQLEKLLKNEIESRNQSFYSHAAMKEAIASSKNADLRTPAKALFDTGMKKVCSSNMEPRMLKEEFDQQKSLALKHFTEHGDHFGKSYSKHIKELEEIITQEYSYYKSLIDKKVKRAFQAASNAYIRKMDEIYKTYQEPKDEEKNHDIAKQEAIRAYNNMGVGEMPKQEHHGINETMRSKNQECQILNEQKKKTARSKNYQLLGDALKLFEAEMNEVCSFNMEPNKLDYEFNRQKRQALEEFKINGLQQIGTSYYEFLEQLEECITQKFSYYKAKIDEKVDAAYQNALEAYTKKLEKIYETYQQPEHETYNHDVAWQEALAAYRKLGVGEMSEKELGEHETLKKMMRKREECSDSNTLKKENADKKNNAAHDKALTSYRDGMQKGYVNIFGFGKKHEKARSKACDDYEKTADKAFPSYQENKADLSKGIEVIHKKYKEERGVGNWFKSWIGDEKHVFIPDDLLKSK